MSIPNLGIDFDRIKDELGSDLGDIFGKVTGAAGGGLDRIANVAQSAGSGLERIAGAAGSGGPNLGLARIAAFGGGASGNTLGNIAGYGGGGGSSLDFFNQLGGSNPFAAFENAKAMYPPHVEEKVVPLPGSTSGAGGGQVASSADNAALTSQQIDAWIAKTRPNAPINGMGAAILAAANRHGVSAPHMLGIFLKESELGTTAGSGKILSGITDPSRDGGLGGQRAFEGFATWEDAIEATARLLGTDMYRGKPLAEQVGNWYVGPNEYARAGVNATDQAGNGTVQDYLNLVSQVYAGLGVTFNPTATPQTVQGGPGYAGSAEGVASIYGGTVPPITQEFGPTAFSTGEGAGIYDFGSDMGLDGDSHTGWDVGAAVGTNFYMPKGLGGTVEIAGGSGYYTDETKGNAPGTGELRINLDNGMQLILGHNSAINVRQGQRVDAGMLLGQTGYANGAHQHVEVRVRDNSTRSGWRIVDPSVLFGNAR